MRINIFQHVWYDNPGYIARYLASRGVIVSTTHFSRPEPKIPALDDIDGLVILGGPMGTYEETDYPWLVPEKEFIREAVRAGKKVLGICLGSQLLAEVLGGRVYRGSRPEVGWGRVTALSPAASNKSLSSIVCGTTVLHWHSDTYELPPGAQRIFSSSQFPEQGFVWGENVLALQFHMEFIPENLPGLMQRSPGIHFGEGDIPSYEELLKGPFDEANAVLDCLLSQFFLGECCKCCGTGCRQSHLR
ncbi:MAG: type 1 glutamine amidotransferase [bacterium]|nr:type 1 glutamine amidotransferase [bacterium]